MKMRTRARSLALQALYEIDLVDLSTVGDPLRQEILRSGVRL